MCGRARCTLNPGQVARACGLSGAAAASVPTHQMDRHRPSFNVSPGSYMPVFVARTEGGGTEGKRAVPTVHCMKWGLIPSFTKKTEKPDHYRMFNARSESVKEKASFRRLIPTNRCLVAVEGFYEWKKDGSKKQPYYIHLKDDRPLVFAALYDSWGSSEGEILYTFTILTTRCSSSLEWLHDRMPVILGSQNSIDLWLNNSIPNFETLLVPYEEHDLVWHPVTSAMGKPSFNGPECIKEIQLKSAVEAPLLKFFSKKIDEKVEPKGEMNELPQEFAGTNSSDRVKEEPADEEKSIKSDRLIPVQKGTTEPNIYGIKNEFEEIRTGSGLTVEIFDSLHPDPPKKKSKTLKNAGDGQASLLSYFGKK